MSAEGVIVRQPGLFEWAGSSQPRTYDLAELHRQRSERLAERLAKEKAGGPAPLVLPDPRAIVAAMAASKRRPAWAGWLPPRDPPNPEDVASLEAYTDGSGTLHDALAGVGVVLCAGGAPIAEWSACIGLGTNNRAELFAIGHAVGLAWRVCAARRPGAAPKDVERLPLTVSSDSDWAVHAASPLCTWEFSDGEMHRLAQDVRRSLLFYGPVTLRWVRGHRPRRDLEGATPSVEADIRGNNRADELAGAGRRAGVARVQAQAKEGT